ncbi:hypothetical protein [Oceanobacillus massiliensis]|uniref:hypothetical protein n=1 Tax=Oceanobacillus massiliensis TaxID=1465765 RepID=UPI003015B417
MLSWKSIEMQVALPRTQDIGKIQENITKQGQHFQESLGQAQVKQQELMRTKVNKSENTYKVKANKGESESSESGDSQLEQENEEPIANHPYLGKRIDING